MWTCWADAAVYQLLVFPYGISDGHLGAEMQWRCARRAVLLVHRRLLAPACGWAGGNAPGHSCPLSLATPMLSGGHCVSTIRNSCRSNPFVVSAVGFRFMHFSLAFCALVSLPPAPHKNSNRNPSERFGWGTTLISYVYSTVKQKWSKTRSTSSHS